MNFFGHTVLAVQRSAEPAFVLGAMLPDFATMIRARPPRTEHADIDSGMQFHWRTDEVFHRSTAFLTLTRRAVGWLSARGVRAGSALAVFHAQATGRFKIAAFSSALAWLCRPWRKRLDLPTILALLQGAAVVTALALSLGFIFDPRYRDFDAASPTMRLADQGVHGALVVGNGIPWRGALPWETLVAIVRRDGEVVRETRGGHPLGNLLFMLPWLAGHAAEFGLPLRAGDLVTAGTWTGVFEAAPGQSIDVEFPDVGRATARFE